MAVAPSQIGIPSGQTAVVSGTAAAWAAAFLTAIGAPVTQNNIDNVVAWGIGESGQPGHSGQSFGGWAYNNPLNVVTQSGDNHIPLQSVPGGGGGQGDIASFSTQADGVAASARLFLGNRNAAPIIQTLRANGSRDQLATSVNQFYASWGGHLNMPGASVNANQAIGGGATSGSGGQTAQLTSSFSPLNLLSPVTNLWSGPIGDSTIGKGVRDFIKGILQPFFNEAIYLGEIIGGFGLIVLGVVIVLVDTGTLSKMPMPMPIPV